MGPKKKVPTVELKIPGFAIPATEGDLDALLERGGLRGKTIHDLGKEYFRSASKMTHKQFALLRVIFPQERKAEKIDQDKVKYGLAGVWEKAVHIVRGSNELGKYLGIIETGDEISKLCESDQSWPGSFTAVRELQEEILRRRMTPKLVRKRRRGSSHDDAVNPPAASTSTVPGTIKRSARNGDLSEEAEDEAGPNATLILLLQRLSSLVAESNLFWTLSRVHYTATFSGGSFRAYTDGALRSTKSRDTMVVVEVKKRGRERRMRQIQFQEAGEIVTWLLHPCKDVPRFNSRALISQDGSEIFVTFAVPSLAYERYLSDGLLKSDATLSMQTYGPWRIGNASDMKLLATLIVAMTLIAKEVAT